VAKAKTQTSTLNPGAAGVNGAAIASNALAYLGSPYVWGGAPGTRVGVDAGTDCSGFTSMVLGRDLSMAVPGFPPGGYTGAEHGGTVADYIAWGGATTLGKGETPLAGDLVCFGPDTHIGIATSASDFVSALNPSLGVLVTDIKGAASGTIVYRRVNGVGTAPSGAGGTGTTGSLGSGIAAALVGAGLGAGVVGVMVVALLGGAALLGVAGAFVVAAAIRRAGLPQ
jgi:cell wall-associated NlpC family hydrolase